MHVTIYTKPGCHLCDDVVEQVEQVRSRLPFDLYEVDIRSDDSLLAQYAFDIPVVVIEGKTEFMHFLKAAQFESRLKEIIALDENQTQRVASSS